MNKLMTIAVGLALIAGMRSFSAEPAGVDAEFVYFEYVMEPLNTRCISLGGTGTALFSGGFSYYNPAGAAFIKKPFVSLDFGMQAGEMSRGAVEAAWTFDTWFAGAAFVGRTVDYPLSDVTGVLPGSGSSQETAFSLLGGWKSEWYAIGFAANGLSHFLAGRDAFALSASGGIAVMLIPEKLTAGAAVLQAGRLHRGLYESTFSAHRDSMATMIRAGAAYSDTVRSVVPYTVSLDAVYELEEKRVLVPVGIEVRPVPPVALRIGKRFNHETDAMTFGIGLTWDNISFDAAFVPESYGEGDYDGEMKWLMGLRYELPGKKVTTKKVVIEADTAVIRPAQDPSETDTTGHSGETRENDTVSTDVIPAAEGPAGETADSDSVSVESPVGDTVTTEPPAVSESTAAADETDSSAASEEQAENETVTDAAAETVEEPVLPSDSTSVGSDDGSKQPQSSDGE